MSIIFPFDENPNVNELVSAAQVERGRKVVAKNKAKSVSRLKWIDELVEFFDTVGIDCRKLNLK